MSVFAVTTVHVRGGPRGARLTKWVITRDGQEVRGLSGHRRLFGTRRAARMAMDHLLGKGKMEPWQDVNHPGNRIRPARQMPGEKK